MVAETEKGNIRHNHKSSHFRLGFIVPAAGHVQIQPDVIPALAQGILPAIPLSCFIVTYRGCRYPALRVPRPVSASMSHSGCHGLGVARSTAAPFTFKFRVRVRVRRPRPALLAVRKL